MQIKNLLRIEIDKNRIYGLDILRAFAILFVLLGHGLFLLPVSIRPYIGATVLDGVSIFFVLSGFLIGTILIKLLEKNKPSFSLLLNFWSRRWFRTLPNYFLVLFLLIFLSLFFKTGFNWTQTKYYFFFLQNFSSPHPPFFGEAWSLSVEEWFYLIVPFLTIIGAIIFKISPKQIIVLVAILIIIFSTAIRYYRYSKGHSYDLAIWDGLFRKQVVTRLDSIMFGVIGAYISFYFAIYFSKYRNFLFVVGLLLLALPKTPLNFHLMNDKIYADVFSFTQMSIGTLFLIPFLANLKTGKGFIYKTFTYISLTSYSMYLINYSLILALIIRPYFANHLDKHLYIIASNLLFYGLTFILSILIFKYFEKPFMNLRDWKKNKL